jgi:hypothetical protein
MISASHASSCFLDADSAFCQELAVQTGRQPELSRYVFDAKPFVKLLPHAVVV